MELEGVRHGEDGQGRSFQLHQPCPPCAFLGIPVILPCPSWSSSQVAEPEKYGAGSAGPGSARGDVLWGRRSWFLFLCEPPAPLGAHSPRPTSALTIYCLL